MINLHVAICAFLCGALTAACASAPAASPPSATSSASPTPGPTSAVVLAMTGSFTFSSYGYSVGFPAGWTLAPATSRWWPPAWSVSDDNSGFDFIDGPLPEGGAFRAASAVAPEGISVDDWVDEFITAASVGSCYPPRAGLPEISVDGQTGRINDGCPDEIEATVVVGRRVYVFTLFLGEGQGRALFDAFAATIDLRPEDAIEVPSPTPSPI
jgi:hypothetical protein